VSYYPEIYDPYYYPYPGFYGYRYGGARLAGGLRPHPAPHLHKGSSFHSRGVAMYGAGRGGGYSGRGGAQGGRGASR